MVAVAILLFVLVSKPFSHESAPPLAEELETIQNPIPETLPTENQPVPTPESNQIDVNVIVDVKGQVHTPGVYTLPSGSRVLDAIQQAGGLLPEAEEKALNLAARLVDEMVIYVPLIGETETAVPIPTIQNAASPQTQENSSVVNINLADETLLMTLPGIGPSKAEAIVDFREDKGHFQSIDELKEVTGIGDRTFDSLKDFISVK